MENKTETKKAVQHIPTFHPRIPLHYAFHKGSRPLPSFPSKLHVISWKSDKNYLIGEEILKQFRLMMYLSKAKNWW